MIVNLWLALSQQALDEFKDRRTQGEDYAGPMDEKTFKILRAMADADRVQRMFKKVDAAGKTYTMFSLYLAGTASLANALDYLQTEWPTHFIVLGAWWWDGRQAGTEWETELLVDPETGENVQVRTGNITGSPLYPVHAQTWKLMPDVVTYDENGEETSRVPAASNADLRDINLLQGQSPRRFV